MVLLSVLIFYVSRKKKETWINQPDKAGIFFVASNGAIGLLIFFPQDKK